MIRETTRQKLEELLTNDYLMDLAINEHVSNVYVHLLVSKDGDIWQHSQIDENEWVRDTVSLWHCTNHYCSCSWCSDWENDTDGVRQEFKNIEDYLAECINQNGDTTNLYVNILDAFNDIPDGFFDDEIDDQR